LQIPGQGLVATNSGLVTLRLGLTGSIHQVLGGPGTGEWATVLAFPPHSTPITPKTAKCTHALHQVIQYRAPPSQIPLPVCFLFPNSSGQARVWAQAHPPPCGQSSFSQCWQKSNALVCLLARPAKAQPVPGTAAGCSDNERGVSISGGGRRAVVSWPTLTLTLAPCKQTVVHVVGRLDHLPFHQPPLLSLMASHLVPQA
jgi:hypothetical protein